MHTRVAAPPRSGGAVERLNRSAEAHPLALVMVAVVLFSAGPVMVSAADAPGPVFAVWRLWIGAVALTAIAVVRRRTGGPIPTSQGWTFAIAAGCAFGLHQLLFITALKLTSVVDVTLVGTLQPVIVAIAAVPLFGERTTRPFKIWTAVAIAGAGIVVGAGSSGADGDPLGMTLAALNILAFSGYYLIAKLARPHIEVVPFLAVTMITAAATASVFGLATGAQLGEMTATDVALATAVALLPGAIGHGALAWSLKWLPANVPPILKLAIPLLSGLMAWVFLDQLVGSMHVAGAVLTIAGVAGALRTAPAEHDVPPAYEVEPATLALKSRPKQADGTMSEG